MFLQICNELQTRQLPHHCRYMSNDKKGPVVGHNIYMYVFIVFKCRSHSGKYPVIRKNSIEQGITDDIDKGINNMLTSNLDKLSIES